MELLEGRTLLATTVPIISLFPGARLAIVGSKADDVIEVLSEAGNCVCLTDRLGVSVLLLVLR